MTWLLVARRGALLVIAASAIVAVLAGLTRLGWSVPFVAPRASEHGPLLVLGVFGAIIALERAVALGSRWAYVAPIAGALGAAAGLAGMTTAFRRLTLLETVLLVGANVAIVRRQALTFTRLMLLGSAALALGTAAWANGEPVFVAVPSWLTFFVLTIIAERIEMSRLAPTPRWAFHLITAASLAIAASAAAAIVWREMGVRLLGAGFVVAAGWELRFDLARRTVHQRGLPGFAATGVLLGAGWLGAAGAGLAVLGLPPVGLIYDAVLHAVFVGFVLSMVFAHAPIILPAVARLPLVFRPALYVPLLLLHGALIARVAGDLMGMPALRRAGGLGNALAIALFVAIALVPRATTAEVAPR